MRAKSNTGRYHTLLLRIQSVWVRPPCVEAGDHTTIPGNNLDNATILRIGYIYVLGVHLQRIDKYNSLSCSSLQSLSPARVPDRDPNHSGVHLLAISRLRSRPFSLQCSRPIYQPVPDVFHDPVSPKNGGLPSRPAISKRGPFSIPSLGKTPKKIPPAAG